MSRGIGFYNKDWFSMKEGKQLLYESIIRILMTTPGERVGRPNFGVGYKQLLFSTITPDFLQDLAITTHNAIDRYEPRVTVADVQISLDGNIVKIHIFFQKEEDPDDTDDLVLRYTLQE